MSQVTGKSMGRNSLYVGLVDVWRILRSIFLTPIILGLIGIEGYGTWTLIWSAAAYVMLFETSFSSAYTKYTSEYDARKDYKTLSETIGSGVALVGSCGAVVLTAIAASGRPLLAALGAPEELLSDAHRALGIVAVCVLLRLSLGCIGDVLSGFQRMDLRLKTQLIGSVVEFGLALSLLYYGLGLTGLALSFLCGQILSLFLSWILMKRLCPDLHISPTRATREGIRRMISLGGRFQALSIVSLVTNQGIKMAISVLLGVGVLGTFELAQKLAMLASSFGGAIVRPLMPAFAHLHATGAHQRLTNLYIHTSKIIAIATIPMLAFLSVFADRVILLWTADHYPLASWSIPWICAIMAVQLLTGVGTSALRAQGKVKLEFQKSVANLILFIAFGIPGYLLWGYEGLIVSMLFAWTIPAIFFVIKFAHCEKLPLSHFLYSSFARPILIFSPVIAATIVLKPWVQIDTGLSTRWQALIELIVAGSVYTCLIGSVAWLRVLSRQERVQFAQHLPRPLLRLVG